ncbi:T9SS type A sorting domain-containing protein [uncultured Maribacter sp.]|uniref:T9SS type A sorting domain-containing protein n=1 Tax=uncultured Maribacter sp. TaxID=431308 RepID=UPI002629E35E|nr:T9SS type A sorting domain-containing protein [uncultured Maribacter sp.]
MKKIYLLLLIVVTYTVSAQEDKNSFNYTSSEIAEFKLYPNPVSNGLVYITTKNNYEKEVIIYDVFGEIVLTNRINNKNLDVSRLVSGVYVVTVIENEKSTSRKLVVK